MKSAKNTGEKLHRLASVREREQVSWKCLSNRTGIPICELKRQGNETTDILLSTLHKWHRAINVPIEELVVEPPAGSAPSLQLRLRLLKLAKTAHLIREVSTNVTIELLAQELMDQFVELMPELRSVASWPTRNTPRSKSEVPRIVIQQIPAEIFAE